ncbi:hypothetical protein ACFSDD_17580 [Salipiger marinus]|uniref:hypothetical protein n=1 Tax=Salipiger marinus TaxID=555512 RepID=UPI002CEE577A|nr:hypothetical protein [Salipiger manganoxidans]MEB3421751.1 hypothetical protein [Salipiger manganoxidans]
MIRRLFASAFGPRPVDPPEAALGDAMLLGRGDLLDRLVRLRANATLMRRSSEALVRDLEGLRADLGQVLGERER